MSPKVPARYMKAAPVGGWQCITKRLSARLAPCGGLLPGSRMIFVKSDARSMKSARELKIPPPLLSPEARSYYAPPSPGSAKIIVYHRSYGCDTGCCGHVIEIDGEDFGQFDFGHPDDASKESARAFAEEMIRDQLSEEHIDDLDWENCRVIYD